jgi:hypothetical protein
MGDKVSSKVTEAVKAYREAVLRDSQYGNIIRVNRCLPKHKQKHIEQVTTGYMTRRFNANQAFQSLYRKLNEKEYRQFRQSVSI